MYFSRSIIISALAGFAAATTHGEAAGMTSVAIGASETLASATASAAGVHSTGVAPLAPEGAMVNTHVVQVGGPNGSLIFSPESITAQPGDLVQFQFNPKNHSVVQSTFDQPCVPIQNVMPNKTDAFFSGFMPAGAAAAGNGTAGGKLTYTIRVMDAKPIWFYCSQGPHCQAGMVGAINAPASGNRTLAGYKQLASAATENLSPGQAAGSGFPAPQASGAPGSPEASGAPGGGEASAPAAVPPTGTAGVDPAQATTNAAPGRSAQSLMALGLGALAAVMAL